MIIVATLGFDERPVIRALSEAGFKGFSKIYLIRPIDDDPRAVKAVAEIKKISSMAGLRDEDVVSLRVDPRSFWESVSIVHDLLSSIAKGGSEEIHLLLGGGLRALVLEAYTAFILLTDNTRSKIKVRVDLETGDHTIIISGEELPPDTKLSEAEHRILEILGERPGLTMTDISDIMVKPASTTHRLLKKLLLRGLLVKKENRYYLSPKGRALLKILASND